MRHDQGAEVSIPNPAQTLNRRLKVVSSISGLFAMSAWIRTGKVDHRPRLRCGCGSDDGLCEYVRSSGERFVQYVHPWLKTSNFTIIKKPWKLAVSSWHQSQRKEV